MKGEIENTLSRESWLLVILMGVFVFQVVNMRYFYWYDLVYTSIALLIAGVVFLFLFNLADGRHGTFNIGSVVRFIMYLAAVVIAGVFIIPLVTFWLLYGLTIYAMLGLPVEITLIAATVGVAILGYFIWWGAKNMWNMAKDYTLHFQYQKQDPTPEPE